MQFHIFSNKHETGLVSLSDTFAFWNQNLLAIPSHEKGLLCAHFPYIDILNVAALDETIIPSCLHFSMQNIEQSRGLGRAFRWSNVIVNQ